MFKKVIHLLLIASMILTFSACGSTSDSVVIEDDGAEYEKSKIISLASLDIKTMNPAISQDEVTYQLNNMIYQSLFELDENLTPQKELVSKYTVSKKGKAITLKLVKDARFSDGEKVTASDVKFTIDAYQRAGKKCVYYRLVDGISTVKVLDTYKLKIRFEEKGDGGRTSLTFPILPEHRYSSVDELLSQKESFKPVGSGSYKVTDRDLHKKIVLKANKKSNGPKAKNRIEVNIYDENADISNLAEGNIVTMSVNKEADRNIEVGSKTLNTTELISNSCEVLGFNFDAKETSNRDFRKAVAYTIDVDGIITRAYYGSGAVTDSILYPGYLGLENKGDAYAIDLKKARELLVKAGFKDKNKDGYVDNSHGKPFTLDIIVAKGNDERIAAAELIAKSLDKAEIKAEVRVLKSKDYMKALKKGKFDIFVGGISFTDDYDVRALFAKKNYTGYHNSSVVSYAKTMNSCITTKEAEKTVKEFKELLNKSLPYYPICYKTYAAMTSSELTGDVLPTFNYWMRGCESWYCNYKVNKEEE